MRVDPAVLEPPILRGQTLAALALLSLLILSAGMASLAKLIPKSAPEVATPMVEQGEPTARILGTQNGATKIALPVGGPTPRIHDQIAILAALPDGSVIPLVTHATVDGRIDGLLHVFAAPLDALLLKEASRFASFTLVILPAENLGMFDGKLIRDLFVVRKLAAAAAARVAARAAASAPVPAVDVAPELPQPIAPEDEAAAQIPVEAVPQKSVIWLSGTAIGFEISEDGSTVPRDGQEGR